MSSVDGEKAQDERRDLEEQRRFLLESLRDLEREHEAGEITDDDYGSLRDDYTARAAAVLRALEPIESEPPTDDDLDVEAAPLATVPARPRRRRALVTVTVIVLIAVAAGLGVALFSGENVSSPSLTAGTPGERLVRAHQRDSAGNALDAVKLYDSVLKDDPGNVEALTYKGWLLARAGLGSQALQSLDQAIAINPKYPDPHFFRGVVLYRYRGDPAAAIPEFETFLAENPPPEAVAAVQAVLDQAKQDLAQKNAEATTTVAPPPPPG